MFVFAWDCALKFVFVFPFQKKLPTYIGVDDAFKMLLFLLCIDFESSLNTDQFFSSLT